MAEETGREEGNDVVHIPEGYRWSDLVDRDGNEQLQFYRQMLIELENQGSELVQQIYQNAQTSLTQPRNLNKLVTSLDELDWFSAREEGLGDMYEGLLEKNATESKTGAGQYFTPRPLIDVMVELTDPEAGEVVQDPAAGTGGFIIAADQHIKDKTDELFDLPEQEQLFQQTEAFRAVEHVSDTHRLGLMNMLLHDIEADYKQGDTLSSLGAGLDRADVILTNPPFGTSRGGGEPTRDDFTFPTSNKQLAFLQHIYRGLKPGGRAAVVAPDNVLFEDSTGQKVRTDLMDKCSLHTILRLPTGIFYAQGVKTNVLFFTRGESDEDETDEVWIFDMRTNSRTYGKRNPLKREDFEEFVEAWGDDVHAPWEGDFSEREQTWDEEADEPTDDTEGRWRRYTRDEIAERGDNLDITWLHDEDVERAEDLPPPEDLAAEIMGNLRVAMDEMEGLMEVLEDDEPTAGEPEPAGLAETSEAAE
jgi:type I restriction enzyme M protein